MGLGYTGLRQGLSSKALLPPGNLRRQCFWDGRVQVGGLSEPALIRELPSRALSLSLSTEGPGVQGALVSSPVDGPLSTQATSEGRRAISPSSKGARGFPVISALWSTLHFPPTDALTTGWITGPLVHRPKPGEGLAFCLFQSCCFQHESSDGTECLSGTLVRDLSEVSTKKKKIVTVSIVGNARTL